MRILFLKKSARGISDYEFKENFLYIEKTNTFCKSGSYLDLDTKPDPWGVTFYEIHPKAGIFFIM